MGKKITWLLNAQWALVCDGRCTGLPLSEPTWQPGGVTVLHSGEHLAAVKDDPSHSSLTHVARTHWTDSPRIFLSGRHSTVLQWCQTGGGDGLCSCWEELSCVQSLRRLRERLIHPEDVRVARQVFIQLERDTMWWGSPLLQAQARPGCSRYLAASFFSSFTSTIDKVFV